MTVYANSNKKVAIAVDSAYGTSGTYNYYLNASSVSYPEGDNGSVPADNADSYNGQEGADDCQIIGDAYQAAKPSVNGLIDPVTAPILFKAGIGADTITEPEAGVVYLHSFQGARTLVQDLVSISVLENKGAYALESQGIKINTMALKWAGENNPVTFEATFLGKKMDRTVNWATLTASTTCPALHHFVWSNASFQYNSGTLSRVRDFTFNIDNKLTEYRDGNAWISEPDRTAIGGTGSLTVVVEDASWFDVQEGQTLNDFVLTTTGAATIGAGSNPEMILTIPLFRVLSVTSDDSKEGLHMITIEFEALGDKDNSGNNFSISVQNTIASY